MLRRRNTAVTGFLRQRILAPPPGPRVSGGPRDRSAALPFRGEQQRFLGTSVAQGFCLRLFRRVCCSTWSRPEPFGAMLGVVSFEWFYSCRFYSGRPGMEPSWSRPEPWQGQGFIRLVLFERVLFVLGRFLPPVRWSEEAYSWTGAVGWTEVVRHPAPKRRSLSGPGWFDVASRAAPAGCDGTWRSGQKCPRASAQAAALVWATALATYFPRFVLGSRCAT